MKGSEKGFSTLVRVDRNFVGEGEREIMDNSSFVRAFQLQKENCQSVSGSKSQMEMIQGNVIVFHCIET